MDGRVQVIVKSRNPVTRRGRAAAWNIVPRHLKVDIFEVSGAEQRILACHVSFETSSKGVTSGIHATSICMRQSFRKDDTSSFSHKLQASLVFQWAASFTGYTESGVAGCSLSCIAKSRSAGQSRIYGC